MLEPSLARLDADTVAGHVRLRADLATPSITVVPGEPTELSVRVFNTSFVIESVRVELLGLMAESVSVSPEELRLFPSESAEVVVTLTFHPTLPAGTHEGLLVVTGASGHLTPVELPFTVEVPGAAAADVVVEPPVRTGGRKVAFEVHARNRGNTPLDLKVHAVDANRELVLALDSSLLHLDVDASDSVLLHARRRRHWTGGVVEHVITVDVEGDGITTAAEARFRQKPRLTAGVITVLTLAFIVALWAMAMLFGVQAALSPAAKTKTIPETFTQGVGLADLEAAAASGAVSGTVTGTVTASTTAQPLARVIIEAFDQRGRLVGATATGDDGTYELSGLLPIRHRLRIRAPGFTETWWPDAQDASGARAVLVSATEPTEGVDAQVTGLPAALGGRVIAGDGESVTISVEAVPLDLLEGGSTAATVTDGQGVWSLTGLVSPATYRITYRAPGYAAVELTQPVGGGQQLAVNTVRLPAAPGSIQGRVVDRAGSPVGGVDVLAQRGEFAVGLTTPTSGEVGIFTLADLETPGTYLLTFTADGFASETRAVRLGPGEQVSGLEVVLAPATGTVSGRAVAPGGVPLGAVRVTVSGGGVVLTTETLTSGGVGTFRLSGLPLPGVYAVTFDLDGYGRETVQVSLDPTAPEGVAEVTMVPSRGAIAGRVVDASTGAPLGAVAVEVSNGSLSRATTTASVPDAERGRFHIGDLPPGTYTITARAPDGTTVTYLRTVTAGATEEVTLPLGASP